MPRDKKVIHRATSDVEDEIISDEEPVEKHANGDGDTPNDEKKASKGQLNLEEERKKYLKEAILKRTLALKKQRERDRHQRVNSTQRQ